MKWSAICWLRHTLLHFGTTALGLWNLGTSFWCQLCYCLWCRSLSFGRSSHLSKKWKVRRNNMYICLPISASIEFLISEKYRGWNCNCQHRLGKNSCSRLLKFDSNAPSRELKFRHSNCKPRVLFSWIVNILLDPNLNYWNYCMENNFLLINLIINKL